ncbi:Hypothetical predicted protein [Olea europaea subsp. europaea]|uniref:Uncharacterized protein n=1 Tax=Olea europaea subsp. europaea TaxID=158383 RepID=A0A8S0RD74_OLEEU|nr:Hypothetical predicted protein [Olea europaea subsp. europaea]
MGEDGLNGGRGEKPVRILVPSQIFKEAIANEDVIILARKSNNYSFNVGNLGRAVERYLVGPLSGYGAKTAALSPTLISQRRATFRDKPPWSNEHPGPGIN